MITEVSRDILLSAELINRPGIAFGGGVDLLGESIVFTEVYSTLLVALRSSISVRKYVSLPERFCFTGRLLPRRNNVASQETFFFSYSYFPSLARPKRSGDHTG